MHTGVGFALSILLAHGTHWVSVVTVHACRTWSFAHNAWVLEVQAVHDMEPVVLVYVAPLAQEVQAEAPVVLV